jgi:hypothetical protein
LPSFVPSRSQSSLVLSDPYTFDPSMKLVMVLICCQAFTVPVPGAAGVLLNAKAPKSFVNVSSLSV